MLIIIVSHKGLFTLNNKQKDKLVRINHLSQFFYIFYFVHDLKTLNFELELLIKGISHNVLFA